MSAQVWGAESERAPTVVIHIVDVVSWERRVRCRGAVSYGPDTVAIATTA